MFRRKPKGMTNPQGMGKPTKPKRYQKLYTYRFIRWLWMIWRGYKILITYNVDKDSGRFSEVLKIDKVTTAQAYGMGYIRGKKIKDELKYMPFKTYVRFFPDDHPPHPVIIMDEDGQISENWETSSTLYDHWKSDSTDLFLKGMTKTVMAGVDQKKLIMIFLLVAGACAGIYFIMTGAI